MTELAKTVPSPAPQRTVGHDRTIVTLAAGELEGASAIDADVGRRQLPGLIAERKCMAIAELAKRVSTPTPNDACFRGRASVGMASRDLWRGHLTAVAASVEGIIVAVVALFHARPHQAIATRRAIAYARARSAVVVVGSVIASFSGRLVDDRVSTRNIGAIRVASERLAGIIAVFDAGPHQAVSAHGLQTLVGAVGIVAVGQPIIALLAGIDRTIAAFARPAVAVTIAITIAITIPVAIPVAIPIPVAITIRCFGRYIVA